MGEGMGKKYVQIVIGSNDLRNIQLRMPSGGDDDKSATSDE